MQERFEWSAVKLLWAILVLLDTQTWRPVITGVRLRIRRAWGYISLVLIAGLLRTSFTVGHRSGSRSDTLRRRLMVSGWVAEYCSKWFLSVVFSGNGLAETPKTTCVNLRAQILGQSLLMSSTQRKRRTSQSSFVTEIWTKAFSSLLSVHTWTLEIAAKCPKWAG